MGSKINGIHGYMDRERFNHIYTYIRVYIRAESCLNFCTLPFPTAHGSTPPPLVSGQVYSSLPIHMYICIDIFIYISIFLYNKAMSNHSTTLYGIGSGMELSVVAVVAILRTGKAAYYTYGGHGYAHGKFPFLCYYLV